MAEGRVEISTELDNTGIKKGISNLPKVFNQFKSAVRDIAGALDTSFGPKQQKQIDTLTQRLARQQEAAQKAARAVDDIRRQYEAVAGMETTPASLRKMETELARVQKEIQKAEKEYENLESQLLKVQERAAFETMASGVASPKNATEMERLTRELDAAGQKLGGMDDRAQQLQSSIERIRLSPEGSQEAQNLASKLQGAEEKAARLANEADFTASRLEGLKDGPEQGETAFQKMRNAVSQVGGAVGSIVSKGVSAFARLANVVSQVGTGISSIAQKGVSGMGKLFGSIKKVITGLKNTTKHTNKAGGALEKFGKRILKLAIAAFVFNQIRKALRQLVDYLGSAMRTNEQYVASLAAIKGNLLTAFQPIYEIVMPALNTFMAGLARVTGYLAAFISFITGKSLKASQDAAESLYDQVDAMDALGNSAKKAAGRLASFDTINQLAAQTSEDSKIAPDFDYDLSEMEDFFSRFDKIADAFYGMGEKLSDTITNFLNNINWDKIQSNARNIAQNIVDFINGFLDDPALWIAAGHTIAQGLNTALIFLDTLLAGLHWETFGRNFGMMLNTIVSEFDWRLLGKTMADGINAIFGFLLRAIETFNWANLGNKLADALLSLTNTVKWDHIALTLSKGLNGVLLTLYTFLTSYPWGNLGSTLANSLNLMVSTIRWADIGATIAAFFNSAISFLLNAVTDFRWGDLGAGLAGAINKLFHDIKWADLGKLVSNFFKGVLDFLSKAVQETDWRGIGKSIGEFLANIDWVEILSKAGRFIGNALIGILNGLSQVIQTVDWQAIGNAAAAFIASIDWSGLTSALFEGIGSAVGAVVQLLYGFIEDIWNNLIDWWHDVAFEDGKFTIQGLLDGIWEAIKNIGQWIKDNIFDPFIKGFKSVFGIASPSTVMMELGGYIIEGLKQGLVGLWDKVKDIFTNTIDNIKKTFSLDNLKSIGSNAVTGLMNGLESIGSKASKWGSGILDDVKNTLGIHSPSTAMLEIGKYLVQGLDNGISKSMGSVTTAFQNLWDGIKSGSKVAAESINSVWKFSGEQIANSFRAAGNTILGTMTNIANGIITVFESAINRIIKEVNRLVDNVNKINIDGAKLSIPKLSSTSIPRMTIPKLATGAVIPPRQEFMAILGDQRNGRNLEAPEGLIRQLLQEEMRDIMADLTRLLERNNQQITIKFEGELAQLARLLHPAIEQERGRIGGGMSSRPAY